MELHAAISYIIKIKGNSFLECPELLNAIDDFHGFDRHSALKNVFRILISEGCIKHLLESKKWDLNTKKDIAKIERNYAIPSQIIEFCLESLAFSLGYIEVAPILADKSPTIRNTSPKIISHEHIHPHIKIDTNPVLTHPCIPTCEYKIITVANYKFRMIRVKGGSFTMGETNEIFADDYEHDSLPTHLVTLSDFWIGESQVTQKLWELVMGSNPSIWKGDFLPVVRISWYDCMEFIKKLNTITGLNFDLPTEAQWEYAARGGQLSHNYVYSGSNVPEDVAWFSQQKENLHPVMQKKPNEIGIYDMSGNGGEWCRDWFGKYQSYGISNNPLGPATGKHKVARGGDWLSSAKYCKVSYRSSGHDPYTKYHYTGMRLIM